MDKIERKVELTNGFKLNLEELYPNVFLDKLDELVTGYNKIVKRLKKDMEHDEVMDSITMKKGVELENHLNSHINLIKEGIKDELKYSGENRDRQRSKKSKRKTKA